MHSSLAIALMSTLALGASAQTPAAPVCPQKGYTFNPAFPSRPNLCCPALTADKTGLKCDDFTSVINGVYGVRCTVTGLTGSLNLPAGDQVFAQVSLAGGKGESTAVAVGGLGQTVSARIAIVGSSSARSLSATRRAYTEFSTAQPSLQQGGQGGYATFITISTDSDPRLYTGLVAGGGGGASGVRINGSDTFVDGRNATGRWLVLGECPDGVADRGSTPENNLQQGSTGKGGGGGGCAPGGRRFFGSASGGLNGRSGVFGTFGSQGGSAGVASASAAVQGDVTIGLNPNGQGSISAFFECAAYDPPSAPSTATSDPPQAGPLDTLTTTVTRYFPSTDVTETRTSTVATVTSTSTLKTVETYIKTSTAAQAINLVRETATHPAPCHRARLVYSPKCCPKDYLPDDAIRGKARNPRSLGDGSPRMDKRAGHAHKRWLSTTNVISGVSTSTQTVNATATVVSTTTLKAFADGVTVITPSPTTVTTTIYPEPTRRCPLVAEERACFDGRRRGRGNHSKQERLEEYQKAEREYMDSEVRDTGSTVMIDCGAKGSWWY